MSAMVMKPQAGPAQNNNKGNNTKGQRKGQLQGRSAPTLSLHDPEFRHLITAPLSAVHHLPPAHLEISRLVLCKKYDPRNPMACTMGEACKFVHLDMNTPGIQMQSIHVNYAYRSLDEVKHERLPAGEMVSVMAPNNRAPCQQVPSELILKTRGAENRNSGKGCNSHCAHYYYNRMCNRGERCSFIHALYIDPNASEFQRAPPRAGCASTSPAASPAQSQPCKTCPAETAAPVKTVVPALAHHKPANQAKVPEASPTSGNNSSYDLTESPRSSADTEEGSSSVAATNSVAVSDNVALSRADSVSVADGPCSPTASQTTSQRRGAYRHNPYSLMEVTLNA